ncbi:zinc metalloproteinase-disintegrin-like berythractivase [Mantella aurantiaca]
MLIPTMTPLVMFILQVLGLHALPTGEKYEVVTPQQIHAVFKRDTQEKIPYLVKYELQIEGKPVVLHLERNEELLTDDYTETSYNEDDSPVTRNPEENLKDHCYYQGYIEDDSESLASISTCSGINGVIVTQGRRLLIEPINLDEGTHALYEEEEVPQKACALRHESLEPFVLNQEVPPDFNITEEETDHLLNSKKYIEMIGVIDNSMFQKYKNDTTALKRRLFDMINYLNMVYKAIQTFVALKGLEFWDKQDQIEVNTSALITLASFALWRQENLLPRIAHDNAQLFTNIDFEGPTVGLANIGTMCSEQYSAGVVQDYSRSATRVGSTLAHEVGHNLGMDHDNKTCSCPSESCIMTPVLSKNIPDIFSKCSLDQFETFLRNKLPKCLLNKPSREKIITPPLCGNNFVEQGEECDCGSIQECKNPCCNATTCKRKPEAVCTEGECCENCNIKQAGSVCRPSLHDCDLPDTCDGKSNLCLDLIAKDGASCMNDQGYCLNGKCPIMNKQCTALWGSGAQVSPNYCFKINRLGKSYGYCTREGENYQPCPPPDIKCGVLFCHGGNPNPSVYANKVEAGLCKAALHPTGMVENGMKCEDEKICYNNVCTNKETVYEFLA